MNQPDEEPIPVVVRTTHWTTWFIPSFALACTACVYVANTIWGAAATHAQVLELSDIVGAHSKQLSVLQDEVSQGRTENAVILEKVTNVEKTLDRIEDDVRARRQ